MEDKMIEQNLGSDVTSNKIRKPYRTPQLVSLNEDLVQSTPGGSACDGCTFCTTS